MTDSRFFDYGRTLVQPIHLQRSETALLIVDMQYHDASPDHGFNLAWDKLEPGCMDYFNRRNEDVVIPTIRKLLQYARTHEMQVIYLTLGSTYRDLRDLPERSRQSIRRLEEESGVTDIFWAGNPAFAIRKEIEPLPDETVVPKTSAGAFNSSPIERVLRSAGASTLIITGISTNACVETTARDAADRGFACVIVDEGTADYDKAAHDAALRGFHFNFGRIIRTAQDMIAALDDEATI